MRRSLFVGRYPSRSCQVIGRTSSGTPDHARSRNSVRDTVLACRMRLNLLMRVMRLECISLSFGDALVGGDVWLMRFNAFAGSIIPRQCDPVRVIITSVNGEPRRISLYCGRRILPSPLRAVGYMGPPRSSAISELLARCLLAAANPNPREVGFAPVAPPESRFLGLNAAAFFLRMLARLGRPNSSSSSSYTISSSSSSSSSSSVGSRLHSSTPCVMIPGYVCLGGEATTFPERFARWDAGYGAFPEGQGGVLVR